MSISSAEFDSLVDFIAAAADAGLEDEDREVHGEHPLTVLIERVLEAGSQELLGSRTAGLSKRTEEQVREARRELERRGKDEELQRLLFSFEKVICAVRESGYGGGDRDNDAVFFDELFPEWLLQLVNWLRSSGREELADQVDAYHNSYLSILELVLYKELD